MSNFESYFINKRAIVLILLTISYTMLFFLLLPILEGATGTFLILPIFMAAWLYGLNTSILYTTFILLWQLLLLNPLTGTSIVDGLTDWGFITAAIILYFVTALVGYLHNLRNKIQDQLTAQKITDEQIRMLNESLEQRVAQQTEDLRESEERWQFALEGSGDGVWDWQINTGYVYFSPQWKRMLGYEPDELADAHQTWESLIHPEDLAGVQTAIKKHLAEETEVYKKEYRIKHKTGNIYLDIGAWQVLA